MLWNHPTIAALAALLTDLLAPQRKSDTPDTDQQPETDDTDEESSVLDNLFDSVESM